ncbi:MAG: DUF2191 domain-containing protein [Betaproteobacteria bacterium]|nr:DUF2191 domain-containing protein [Betaproteobacteria bacterium]
MRTTIRLKEALLGRAKREAARRGVTLTALIEQGLRLALARPAQVRRAARVVLPVCRRGGGVHPGVNLDNSANLLDRMDERG